jgi:homoserine acetyltransferase
MGARRPVSERFDTDDWLCQSWADQANAIGVMPGLQGDTGRALASIAAEMLILAPPLDLLNPVAAAHASAARIQRTRFVEIPSFRGHYPTTSLAPGDSAFLNAMFGASLSG